jgi:hypothetical protein
VIQENVETVCLAASLIGRVTGNTWCNWNTVLQVLREVVLSNPLKPFVFSFQSTHEEIFKTFIVALYTDGKVGANILLKANNHVGCLFMSET